ncbi:hypothetical protein DFJ58DRAFT_915228 [Suillus subalutaceus]|uniref:uncharacterized protein n=1 Tax=Suillus subalutaceus TaxID=48586 RepID=UPI001B87384A|nr:uncharacterized protein DFJ58DRAFT_915228 [Suillus subalutaceus]KAG1847559.1 hypothetical protein DFJ58DRAFT_915228 [Suillus subalutaceus]
MSSSTQDLIPQLHLGNTFGALFIGIVFAAILFGLSNIQAFFYFQAHRDTAISFPKLAVAWLWILDALHLFLIVHCVYYYLVAHYADISALTEIVWSFKLQIVFDVIIVYGVHLLYFHHIWIVLGCYRNFGFSPYLGHHRFHDNKAHGLHYQHGLSDEHVFTDNYDYIYVNSFFALLNARHYLPPATETNHSPEVHMRYGIYRPELNVMTSQDEEFQGSRKNIFKHPGDEVMHITRSAMPHRPIEATVETNSFSSA